MRDDLISSVYFPFPISTLQNNREMDEVTISQKNKDWEALPVQLYQQPCSESFPTCGRKLCRVNSVDRTGGRTGGMWSIIAFVLGCHFYPDQPDKTSVGGIERSVKLLYTTIILCYNISLYLYVQVDIPRQHSLLNSVRFSEYARTEWTVEHVMGKWLLVTEQIWDLRT